MTATDGQNGFRAARNVDVVGMARISRDDAYCITLPGGDSSNNNTDASTKYVDCGNHSLLAPSSTQAQTFEIWFRPHSNGSALAGNQCIAALWDVGSNSSRWAITNASGGSVALVLVYFAAAGGTDTYNLGVIGSQTAFVADRWACLHVVMNVSAGTQAGRCIVYVNGVRDNSATNANIPSSLVSPCTSHLRIGRWQGRAIGNSVPFCGDIENPHFWNRALSDAEVAQRYNEMLLGTGSNSVFLSTLRGNVNRTSLVSAIRLDGTFTDDYGRLTPTTVPSGTSGPVNFVHMKPAGYVEPYGSTIGFMGDSITAGSQWDPGDSSHMKVAYRDGLITKLRRTYAKSIRVRSTGLHSDGNPPSWWSLIAHDGVVGERYDQFNARLPALVQQDPDIIVMLGGTNDIGQGATASTTATRLSTCLTTIYTTTGDGSANLASGATRDPRKPTFVMNVPPYQAVISTINTFNATNFPSTIASAQANGWAVIPVDIASMFTGNDDLAPDGIHPIRSTYSAIGSKLADFVAPWCCDGQYLF